MGVFIKGMEMPKKCAECNFCVNDGKDERPIFVCACKSDDLVNVLVEDYGVVFGFRPSWCPLIPLPEEHGDLIDRDALIEKCGDWYTEEGAECGFIGSVKSLLDAQPTIIEAEGSET